MVPATDGEFGHPPNTRITPSTSGWPPTPGNFDVFSHRTRALRISPKMNRAHRPQTLRQSNGPSSTLISDQPLVLARWISTRYHQGWSDSMRCAVHPNVESYSWSHVMDAEQVVKTWLMLLQPRSQVPAGKKPILDDAMSLASSTHPLVSYDRTFPFIVSTEPTSYEEYSRVRSQSPSSSTITFRPHGVSTFDQQMRSSSSRTPPFAIPIHIYIPTVMIAMDR
ncbi:hypothetical protein ONZ45_g1897 [Pleurotus djamor]|nr:hypothetical protein ONZ45_g1897 [Pleurotus djamor]